MFEWKGMFKWKVGSTGLLENQMSEYLRIQLTLPRFLVGLHVVSDPPEFAFCRPPNPPFDRPWVYTDTAQDNAKCQRNENGKLVPAKGRKLADSEIVGPQRKHIYKIAMKLPTINWEKIKKALKPREYTNCTLVFWEIYNITTRNNKGGCLPKPKDKILFLKKL